jgi:uncharacterized Zn finger protein
MAAPDPNEGAKAQGKSMSLSSPLAIAASRQTVRRLAGPATLERGELYAYQGRVRKLAVTETSARATVHGTGKYRVDLTVNDDGVLGWSCSCPVGAEGGFCKHCVAVALKMSGGSDAEVRAEPAVDVTGYLRALDHDRLVELLLDLAAEDELLAARLELDAIRAQAPGPPPIRAFKDAIDGAFVTHDYVDYRDAYDYAQNIDTVLDTLHGLLADGHADAVIELCEHALMRTEDAIGYVDDSDGWLGRIAERIGELHLTACTEARPDPVALAERLFHAELDAETFNVFSGGVVAYAQVLGDTGLAAYRQLAEEAWSRLPALGPGDERGAGRTDRFRITQIMQTLAVMTGDVDAQVAVLARDLSSAWQYVRIVDAYRTAARHEDALAWAEKGIAAFELTDARLVEALAEEYHHAGRGTDAVKLIWRLFDRHPVFAEYQRLRRHAIWAQEWEQWRDKAIDRLRRDTTKRGGRDATELAQVYLHEGDTDTAWAEATRAGASARLWLQLAAAREITHPADAIPIYQADVEHTINAKNNDAYRAAVDRLSHIATLMTAAGQPDSFGPYVAEVRRRHKPKRNLMKLFDQRGW